MKKLKKNSWDEHLTRLKNIFSSSHFSCICRIALIFNSASVFQLNTAVVKQKSQWVSHKKIFSHVAHFFTKTIQCGHFNEMGGCEVLDLFLSIYPLRDNEWARVWRGEAKCKLILNIITHHSKSDFSLSLRHYSKQQTWKITNCRNFANSWNGNNFFYFEKLNLSHEKYHVKFASTNSMQTISKKTKNHRKWQQQRWGREKSL